MKSHCALCHISTVRSYSQDLYLYAHSSLTFLFSLPADKTCFNTLFNHEDMHEILRHLPICHVEAPGQHEGAKTLPSA